MKISKGIKKNAIRFVIYGLEGIGKTTFASKFPDPLFIDTEGSTRWIDVARVDGINCWADICAAIDEVIAVPSVCKTLVVDTADGAEHMLAMDMLRRDDKKSIEDYGYGKGYTILQERFQKELLNRLDKVIAKGIHVIITAHSRQRTVNPPDGNPYDHYELKCSKNVSPILKEWADCLFFMNYSFVVMTDSTGKGKAQGKGERVIYTTHMPQYDAKNRFGLPDELPMKYESIKSIVEGNTAKNPERTHLAVNAPNKGIVDDQDPVETTGWARIQQLLKQADVPEEKLIAVMEKKGYGSDPDQYSETVINSILNSIDATIKVLKGEN